MHRLRGISIVASLVGLFVLSLTSASAALDNNLAWDWLYHAAEGQDPETEDVPGGGGVEFRTVDPSGNVYPTTSVDIYALTEEGDASSANVRYWTTSEHWVSMTKVYTVTDTFRGQGPKTFDVWKTTIPPQTAGMTVYYRVQINDGSHDAYLKADEGDFQNPLGQNVDDNNDDSWDYSYTVSPAPGGGTGNCDVAWSEALHDTFDPDYRSPIGATIPGIT
ncbi:MAG TPA: hypothetical protein VER55_07995, partial [Ardenticatenaceae bacterium]|nr:hypothetical protein [Ardenticatenaceae bacterium]